MWTFREVTVSAMVLTGAAIVLHALMARGRGATLPATQACTPVLRLLGLVRQLAGLALLGSGAGLALTGFYPILAGHARLAGYSLMAHVTLGGVFAASLAVFAVLAANRHRFCLAAAGEDVAPIPSTVGQRVCFWTILALGIPLILLTALNMFPLFAVDQQGLLLGIHRASALGVVAAGVFYVYLSVRMCLSRGR